MAWERGEELWCTTIHYVGQQTTHSVQVEEEHAEAAPFFLGWPVGAVKSAKMLAHGWVVDAPNVARYFQGQRDAPTSQTVLQNALDELFRQVPRASQLCFDV